MSARKQVPKSVGSRTPLTRDFGGLNPHIGHKREFDFGCGPGAFIPVPCPRLPTSCSNVQHGSLCAPITMLRYRWSFKTLIGLNPVSLSS